MCGEKSVSTQLYLSVFLLCRDICASGSGRALECVGALQDCLTDPCPAVAALAVQAIATLTHQDALDFYSAWGVLAQLLPPQQVIAAAGTSSSTSNGSGTDTPEATALLAAELLDFCSCSVLDTRVYPDRATAILQLLWAVALQHNHPLVRAAALRSLAAYPLDLLDDMELPVELGQYTAPLNKEAAALEQVILQQQQQEQGGGLSTGVSSSRSAAAGGADASCFKSLISAQREAVAAAEKLALVAVAREHEHRRRFLVAAAGGGGGGGGEGRAAGGAAGAAGGREMQALQHRLLHSLPLQLTAAGIADKTTTAAAAGVARVRRGLPAAGGAGGGDGGGLSAPGAYLLLWRPKKGSTSTAVVASSNDADEGGDASVTSASGDPWQVVFQDVVERLAVSGWSHPGMAVAAWEAFMTR